MSRPDRASAAQPLSAKTLRTEPRLAGWGRLGVPGREVLSENLAEASRGAVLSRGLGRSYGDSSLPAAPGDRVVGTRLANRLLMVDFERGIARAEAGLSLAEANRIWMPRGWASPVTPGTKFVTLGGMVASDVHGKNHHVAGTFGAHVRRLRMRLADGDIVECGPDLESDLFHATVGGMGLLGHILEVELSLERIPSAWVWMESERVRGVDEFLDALSRAAPRWPMTMGWIDCLSQGSAMGRGILMAGRWASAAEASAVAPPAARELSFPAELPDWVLNNATASAFNTMYYWSHAEHRRARVVPPDPFFYPLDAILDWNRVYGARGFTQYQCVIPRSAGARAVRAFMDHLTRLGGASPLCVIKDCGPQGNGLLSFPLEGTSIAVDMAISPDIQRIVDQLNAFVIEVGGRIYLTKDRFTRAADYRAMDPRLPSFLAAREKWDPHRRLRSAQSVRLFGDRA
ncbi:MAG: FAD-binding oxidoreductase [Polyangiaceae bacterium]|nr:FAD-binding oxidoreductase [Polyangiaceae bacterium]